MSLRCWLHSNNIVFNHSQHKVLDFTDIHAYVLAILNQFNGSNPVFSQAYNMLCKHDSAEYEELAHVPFVSNPFLQS